MASDRTACHIPCMMGMAAVERTSDVGDHVLNAINTSTRGLSSDIGTAAREVLMSECDSSRMIQKQVADSALLVQEAACSVTDKVKDTVERAGHANREAIDRIGLNIRDAVDRYGNIIVQDVNRTAALTQALVAKESSEIRSLQNQTHTQVLLSLKDILLEQCKSDDHTRSQAAQHHTDSLLNACKNTERLDRSIDAVDRRAVEHFAALSLKASENKNDLSRQLAECCCELKEALKDAESSRLREQLADCRLREAVASSIRLVVGGGGILGGSAPGNSGH